MEEVLSGSQNEARQHMSRIVGLRSHSHVTPVPVGSGDDKAEPSVATRNLDYAETLEVLLQPYLLRGYPPARLASSLMNVSVRTQARRLSELGMTYRVLIDRARLRVARRLLRDTDERISDVAAKVGFVDASNFARMFRRIAGVSPREFRRQALAED